jgi:hypothetical protein
MFVAVVCCIFDRNILLVICEATSLHLVPFVVPVYRRRTAFYKWDRRLYYSYFFVVLYRLCFIRLLRLYSV